jgi:hypothetical protein
MTIYAVITALISFLIIWRWKFAFWLDPLQILFLLDLIPIDGFNRIDGLYKVSELRENINVVVNIINLQCIFCSIPTKTKVVKKFLSYHILDRIYSMVSIHYLWLSDGFSRLRKGDVE